jgi:hypothetical protein
VWRAQTVRPRSGPEAAERTGTAADRHSTRALARSGLDMCRLCHVLLLGLLAVESKSTWVLKADKWATSAQADGGSTAPLGTIFGLFSYGCWSCVGAGW